MQTNRGITKHGTKKEKAEAQIIFILMHKRNFELFAGVCLLSYWRTSVYESFFFVLKIATHPIITAIIAGIW